MAPGGLAAVFISSGSTSGTLYFVHSDYLGSILGLSNESGYIAEEYAYDAWGNRRSVSNWATPDNRTDFLIKRGYTMHEHIDGFGLINMNGRVYDPKLGRFLSPDPILQDAGNTQNLNRYSYVLNNPLKYTDPSGYTYRAQAVTFKGRENPDGSYGNFAGFDGGGGSVFQKMGVLNGEAGPTFENYTYSNGEWIYNENMYYFRSESARIIISYLQSGFDIQFQHNGKYNYALAIYKQKVLGSAAGIIWNSHFGNYGLHNGFNKGYNSFTGNSSNIGNDDLLTNIGVGSYAFDRIGNGSKKILDNRGAYMPKGQIYKVNKEIIVRTAVVNVRTSSKVLNAARVGGTTLGTTGSIVTTGWSYNQIRKGNAGLLTYSDATIGTIGLMNSGAGWVAGASIPVVGEFVALYGGLRITMDAFYYLGENYGPRTWVGKNDYKYFE